MSASRRLERCPCFCHDVFADLLVVVMNLAAILIRNHLKKNIPQPFNLYYHATLMSEPKTRNIQTSAAGSTAANPPKTAVSLFGILIEVKDNFGFNYGTQVLFDLNLRIPNRKVTALIGRLVVVRVRFARFNRMNDLIDGISHTGDITIGGQSIFDPALEIISL